MQMLLSLSLPPEVSSCFASCLTGQGSIHPSGGGGRRSSRGCDAPACHSIPVYCTVLYHRALPVNEVRSINHVWNLRPYSTFAARLQAVCVLNPFPAFLSILRNEPAQQQHSTKGCQCRTTVPCYTTTKSNNAQTVSVFLSGG